MNLHEYQAKQLFQQYGLPVPKGVVVNSLEQIPNLIISLTAPWVVKAQIHAGGRGKGGGIKIVNEKEALETAAKELLHSRLVTPQTTKEGQPVNALLIEEASVIEKELYLSLLIQPSHNRLIVMSSTEGGMDIEEVAKNTPEKILTVEIDPLLNIMPYQSRELGVALGLNTKQLKQFNRLLIQLNKLFIDKDLSLIEINPLVITKQGGIECLDAKINVDDNALYRQESLRDLRDLSQEDPLELRAKDWELNYVSLEGDIGCMVNGAGLAMATMDLIKIKGGMPANFLDVGGGATEERVREAFKIILSHPKVKAIFINIFGGIVRCDIIAKGIMNAVLEVGIKIPVVVRLEGNQATEARTLLQQSGLNILAVESFEEAAIEVVKLAKVSSKISAEAKE